jgi:hypothetical protein
MEEMIALFQANQPSTFGWVILAFVYGNAFSTMKHSFNDAKLLITTCLLIAQPLLLYVFITGNGWSALLASVLVSAPWSVVRFMGLSEEVVEEAKVTLSGAISLSVVWVIVDMAFFGLYSLTT